MDVQRSSAGGTFPTRVESLAMNLSFLRNSVMVFTWRTRVPMPWCGWAGEESYHPSHATLPAVAMDLLLKLPAFSQSTLLLFTGLVALCVWCLIHRWTLRNHPGPASWPVIGAVLEHASHLADFHDYITDYCRKHRTFRVLYPGYDYVFTADPANVEYMLKTNFTNFVKGELVYEIQREVLGEGIFNVDGDKWKEQRKVASFEFSSMALREYSEDAFRCCASKLARLIVCQMKSKGQIEMQDLLMRMTFEAICKTAFGMDMGSLLENPPPEQQAFSNAFDNANEHIFSRYVDPLWKLKRWLRVRSERQFSRNVQTVEKFLYSFMERRKMELGRQSGGAVQPSKPDLLSRFLALNEIQAGKFSDQKIRDVILNFMIAGRDTTALTLCWFFYVLSLNPDVEDKLVQEIFSLETEEELPTHHEDFPSDESIQRFSELLTYDKLSKMNYLHACLSETLRMFPVVPVDGKTVVSPDKLPDGTVLKKGDNMNYAPYAMGRMEWIWGEDVHAFKPERFLRDGVYHQQSPFKFSVFQAGPRMCLGKDFAYLQMKATAALLLRFFTFRLVPGHTVRYRVMLTLHLSREGLKMHAFPRLSTAS